MKQIVTAHRGDVEVRSTADDGTTFGLRLPRWKGSPQEDDSVRGQGAG